MTRERVWLSGHSAGKALVTGGAGFIGSHLVDALLEENTAVTVWDNLSAGTWKNLRKGKASDSNLTLVEQDLASPSLEIPEGCEIVYHLAANPDVQIGAARPGVHFTENIVATHNLLEAIRKSAGIEALVFASTSTVYGEPEMIPTPESFGPMKPISTYGASKLAAEAMISAYANTYGFRAVIYRLANVIGPRSTHGVIYDFIQKLRRDPATLEVLGDGSQTKSYLHVKDCVSAFVVGQEKSAQRVSILNAGSEDQINVLRIAEIVCKEMGLRDVSLELKPATRDGRGWIGDVKFMRLDVSALKSLGWSPTMNSEDAVVATVRQVLLD
jgi:UDP-glucose 4-epimerase